MYTRVTGNGQIVLPASVHRKLGLKKGMCIHVDVDDEVPRILLTPITREYVESLRGCYRGRGLIKALAIERRRDEI